MDRGRRRAVFERVRDQAIALGTPMDNDPLFLDWVEEWISGRIEADELKSRYASLLIRRSSERRFGLTIGKAGLEPEVVE